MSKPNSKPDSKFELWSQKTMFVKGVPIKVVDEEEAEKAHVVVCVKAGEEQECFKADNVYTTCADCGCAITHRPYVPKAPPRICVECTIRRMEKEAQEDCDA